MKHSRHITYGTTLVVFDYNIDYHVVLRRMLAGQCTPRIAPSGMPVQERAQQPVELAGFFDRQGMAGISKCNVAGVGD